MNDNRTRALLTALVSFALLGIFRPSSVIADPGPVTDLQVTISGPSAAPGGADFAVVVVVDNNGPGDADGAGVTVTVPSGSANLAANCVANNALATCPSSLSISGNVVTGTVPSLGFDVATSTAGSVTITVTGWLPSPGPASVQSSASVAMPAGVTDSLPATNTSNINTVMDYRVDLGVVKTVQPGAIVSGEPVVYTIVITNNGPSSADGAELGDNLSTSGTAGSIYDTFSSAFIDCAVTGGAVCPTVFPDRSGSIGATNPLGGTFGRFPAGATVTLRYSVLFDERPEPFCGSATSGRIRNRAFVYNRVDTNSVNNSSDADISTGDIPDCVELDLQTTKTGTESSVDLTGSQPIDFEVTFTNAGPGDGDGATITDYLTSAFTSGAVISDFSCTATSGVACPAFAPTGNASIVFDAEVGPWAAGATLTITYTAVLIPSDPDDPFLPVCVDDSNRIAQNLSRVRPASNGVDEDESNNDDAYRFGVAPAVPECTTGDIGITKSFTGDPSNRDPRQVVPFELVISNLGVTDASAVSITDQLTGLSLWSGVPIDVSFGACTTTGGATCPTDLVDGLRSATASVLLATILAELPAGSTLTIPYSVTFVVPDEDICSTPLFGLYNTASVHPPLSFTDLVPENNNADLNLDRQGTSVCTDVAIIKSVDPTTAVLGGPVTYTLRVSNAGTQPADSVLVRDALPSFFQYGSASCAVAVGSPECGTIDVSAGVLTTTLALLEPGDAVDIVIVGVAVGQPGTYANVATAQPTPNVSQFIETNPATNSSQVNTQVVPPAPPTTASPTTTESPVTTDVASEPGSPTSTTSAPPTLPTTGSSIASWLVLAAAAIAAGFALRVVRRSSSVIP